MKRLLQILCLTIAIGCATNQKGILQPNKIENKNSYVSRVVPRAEADKKQTPIQEKVTPKLEKGGVLPPQDKATSTNIAPPTVVKEEKGIITVKNEPKMEKPELTKEEREEFWDKVFRYSLFWFGFLGFVGIVVYSFKKNKLPTGNPFKKKEQKKEPPQQLTLNL